MVCLSASVQAADVLTGRIISVSPENQSLFIEIIEPAVLPALPGRQMPDHERSGLVQVSIPREVEPPRALRGRVIRAWGDYEQGTDGFTASQIDFWAYPGPGEDPTGVRRRLGKRCGHGRAGGGRPCGR
jgi:hypothetical protein